MRYLKDNYNENAMEKKFTESYKIMCKLNEPFHEKMKKIYEYKSINNESEFMECTELGKGVYRKLVTQTSHIKNGICTLKNQYFSL